MTNSGNKYKFATIMKNRSTKKTVTLQKKLKTGKFGKPCEYDMFGGETTAEDVIKRLEKSNPDSTWRIAEAAEETIEESTEEIKEETKMKTFAITVNHGAAGLDETKREFFVTAEDRKAAKKAAVEQLQDCGNDGYEYIVEIEETTVEESTKEAIEKAPVKKTKTFMACVTLNGKVEVLTMEYPTKKAFAADIRANGYRIQFISTPEKFDEDCEKYHDAVEKTKRIHKAQYDTYKNSVMRNEMTFKEWRAWLKAE